MPRHCGGYAGEYQPRAAGRLLVLIAAAALLGACATAPTREMDQARQSLQAARAVDAQMDAPRVYGRAASALSRAEAAVHRHAYGEARLAAASAERTAAAARQFVLVAREAREALAKADGMGLPDNAAAAELQRATDLVASRDEAAEAIGLAERARSHLRGLLARYRDAVRISSPPPKPVVKDPPPAARGPAAGTAAAKGAAAPAAVTPPTPAHDLPATYTVQRGDNLWRIAGRPEIYDDSTYWPLIYRANRDEIHDADLLSAGQVLNIDRHPSPAAIVAAVDYARRRHTWAVGTIEAIDKAYLAGDSTP